MDNSFKFKKKFGQNFLIDKNIVNKIVDSISYKPNSLVLEIGCGDGRLTTSLCEKFDHVLGFEIDLEVKDRLLTNLSRFSNYDIIFDDFLKVDLNEIIGKYEYDNLYVIANLPYYITTPIIEKLINSDLDFESINVMVQKEVADRFCAVVGDKNYNSLTVYLNYYFNIKKLFDVSRNCFVPRPNVDSSVVSFVSKDNKLYLNNQELFFNIVRDSFRFKRKTLKNNLNNYDLEKIRKVLLKYGYDLSVRAEDLSLEVFCDIANELSI